MSSEPSESEISNVIEITALDPVRDRQLVIQALKVNQGNLEVIITEYFEDSASFRQKYTWDDTAFAADREGNTVDEAMAFHIETIDNQILPAPSRPPTPSRLKNNRSPSGKAVDWSPGMPGVLESSNQEDEDLQRALEASAAEAGILLQDAEMHDAAPAPSVFGPANRLDYDPGQWAVVPRAPQGPELSDEVLPSWCRRAARAPGLLITTDFSDTRLGPILTILHEIPLARNALLQIGVGSENYGQNSQWWNGQKILSAEVLAGIQDGTLDAAKQLPAFHEELHRLMAFLDDTERSYGSITPLLSTLPKKDGVPELAFYEAIIERADEGLLSSLATSVRATNESMDDSSQHMSKKTAFVNISLGGDSLKDATTFEEIWDHFAWSTALIKLIDPAKGTLVTFEEQGDVFGVRFNESTNVSPFPLPFEWYPERHLLANKEIAVGLIRNWLKEKKCLRKIEHTLKEATTYRTASGVEQPLLPELDRRIAKWTAWIERVREGARYRVLRDSGFDDQLYPGGTSDVPLVLTVAEDQIVRELEVVIENLKNKRRWAETAIQEQEQHIAFHQDAMRVLGKVLSQPSPEQPAPMKCKKYLLRGVVSTNKIVYVCRRTEQSLIEVSEQPDDQWWRLEHRLYEDPAVLVQKVEVETIQRLVWQETERPMLLFATEDALAVPAAPLSDALRRFVKVDNRYFQHSLAEEEKRAKQLGELASAARDLRSRSSSIGSMDTNRASMGDSDSVEDVDMSSFSTLAGDDPAAEADVPSDERPIPSPPPYLEHVEYGNAMLVDQQSAAEGLMELSHSDAVQPESPVMGQAKLGPPPSYVVPDASQSTSGPTPDPEQVSGVVEMKEVGVSPLFTKEREQRRGSPQP